MNVCLPVCLSVCLYVCMYVRTYVCMCVGVCMYTYVCIEVADSEGQKGAFRKFGVPTKGVFSQGSPLFGNSQVFN